MLALANNILRLWLFLTVLFYSTNAYRMSSGEKTVNLKFGFDLTNGKDGSPSLSIRGFEGSSELKTRPRAADESVEDSPIRADSSSDSSEKGVAEKEQRADRDDSTKERAQPSAESDEDSDGSPRMLSTQGLDAADNEPEDNPMVHPKSKKDSSESDSNQKHRKALYHQGRRKRDVSLRRLIENMRTKNNYETVRNNP